MVKLNKVKLLNLIKLKNFFDLILFLSTNIGFIIIIIICILGALRRSRLFFEWVCLEINIIAVIPLLCSGFSETSIINRIKYFISQRVASLVFIIRFLRNHERLISVFCVLAMLFKIGIPPFHSWLIRIISNIKYFDMFLIISVQKFIPLVIIRQLEVSTELFILLAISSFLILMYNINLVSSIGVLFFLSASGNSLWIVRVSSKTELWLVFLIAYCFVVMCRCALLRISRVYKVSDLFFLKVHNLKLLRFQFLNIGGLPPITGFILKLIILKVLINFSRLETVLLVINSLIVLFIYVVFIYQCFTVNPGKAVQGVEDSSQNIITVLVVVRRSMWILLIII